MSTNRIQHGEGFEAREFIGRSSLVPVAGQLRGSGRAAFAINDEGLVHVLVLVLLLVLVLGATLTGWSKVHD